MTSLWRYLQPTYQNLWKLPWPRGIKLTKEGHAVCRDSRFRFWALEAYEEGLFSPPPQTGCGEGKSIWNPLTHCINHVRGSHSNQNAISSRLTIQRWYRLTWPLYLGYGLITIHLLRKPSEHVRSAWIKLHMSQLAFIWYLTPHLH